MAGNSGKTQQKLIKQLKKLISRQGAEVTLGIVSGMISAIAAKKLKKESGKKKKETKTDSESEPAHKLKETAAATGESQPVKTPKKRRVSDSAKEPEIISPETKKKPAKPVTKKKE